MCGKIIRIEDSLEFDRCEPLDQQVEGAKEILVSYDPLDPKIDSFVGQIELMVKNGISLKADIKVKANNFLNGIKLERKLEKLKLKLDVNEVVKGLTRFHSETDRKLGEIANICLEKIDER